jgi:16S rRNA (cytosine967-C5)-methyltransferase
MQASILADAARYVRPKGRLVYATCSPFRAEDEQVVEDFLAKHAGFTLEDAARHLPSQAQPAVERGFLRAWPEMHGGGAFFAARLARTAAED